MKQEWYRKITWTKEDEEDFYSHLKKTHGTKGQYICIQAYSLLCEKRKEYFPAIIELYTLCINVHNEYHSDITSAYLGLATVYSIMNDTEKAILNFKLAVKFEEEQSELILERLRAMAPIRRQRLKEKYGEDYEIEEVLKGVASHNAFLCFSEYIIKNKIHELFCEAKRLLLYYDVTLKRDIYKANSLLAIIYNEEGDKDLAKTHKERAEQAAKATDSGFTKHKDVGLVLEHDKTLDDMIKKI